MKRFAILVVITVLIASTDAFADTVLTMNYLFNGWNIYAATLVNDGIYKMWYGGWQLNSDYPNDKIYYRTSADNTSYSDYVTVLTPSQVSPMAVHVNDPSVTKHFNQATQAWQYTMFYTVCMSPCAQSDNQIWSSVSNDGVTWSFHQMLLSGVQGSAEPSAIFQPEADGTFWKVYYVDRNDCHNVKMARVDGNRHAISSQTVYTWTGSPGCISGAEVRFFNGKWHLFFNAFFLDSWGRLNRIDIYKSESTSNTSWPSTFELLIASTGPTYCATLTPGVLPVSDVQNQYDLYFGLVPRQADGTCDITQSRGIHRWRWQD